MWASVVSHPDSYFVWLPLGEESRADRLANALMERRISVSTAEPFCVSTTIPQALRIALGSVPFDSLRPALLSVRDAVGMNNTANPSAPAGRAGHPPPGDGVRVNGVESHAKIVIRRRGVKKMARPGLNQHAGVGGAPVSCWVLICAGVCSQKALACSLPASARHDGR